LRKVDRIFVQNVEQAQLCKALLGRDSMLVPNCYEAPETRSTKAGDDCILWVSTIRQLKRPELFLELALAFPNLKFRMIGGPGDGELALFDDIKARAATIGNLEFLGFLPFHQTEAQFDQATVLVNTSESEGVPNAFLQAWARSVPTVSFIDAGARLEGAQVGVTTGSIEEMITSVAELIANKDKRLAEGRRGAEYVKRHHSPESIVQLYERIFEDMTRDQGPHEPRSGTQSTTASTAESER
jgi:glycosyltransferase involved in cell wall biosynthesis